MHPRTARLLAVLLTLTLAAGGLVAHPGATIVVSANGTVYFVDTGAGLFSIDRQGRLLRRDGPAFHWFALDEASRYRSTPWPSIPGAEFRSAGVDPTLILSSDFPVTVDADGTFYYPDGTDRERVRIMAVDPSGRRTVRATLPPIERGGETITWINGLTAARDGSIYYTEDRSIRRVDRRGVVTVVIQNVTVPGCTAVPGVEAATGPYLRGLAVGDDGSVYAAASGCAAVVKVDAQGRLSTFLRVRPPWSPTAVATAGSDLYALEYLHTASDDRREWIPRVRKISRSGAMTMLPAKTRN